MDNYSLQEEYKLSKKIISILVCMLLFVTVSTVTGKMNFDTNDTQVSAGLAQDAQPITTPIIQSTQFYDPAKAFLAYDPTSSLPQGPCEFNLDTPGTITSLQEWLPGSNGFCTGAVWTLQNELYMCDYSTSNSMVYLVDPTTGDHTDVGLAGKSLHAMAYDVTTGIIYGAGGTGNAANLYTIDPETGAATLVGAFGTGGYMLLLTCDGEGNMYGIDISTDQLYSINKETGAGTSIGPTGQALNYAQDMCYDIDNGILYVAGYTTSGILFTCNVETGTCTSVGPFQGGSEVDAFAIPYQTNMPPETPDAPDGPDTGSTDQEYTFTAVTDDPENDQILYMFDWGDTTYSEWVGPFSSGSEASAKHTYTDVGTFNVLVKAKDTNGGESGWSAAHQIAISEGFAALEIQTITGGLFKVKTSIKNVGTLPIASIAWNITLVGGAFIGKQSTGTITSLAPGASQAISSKFILGFGKTVITVKATSADASDLKEQNGTILLFFIKV
jgi:hypothetical protein